MKVFQNYHRHAMYTNVRISDSAVTPKDYAERAKALGHGILSSAEHGWQGNYFKTVRLAKEYGLKPLIGAEAYWVKDRAEKDRTNCHIFLGAKNERGRQALNDVLSERKYRNSPVHGMYIARAACKKGYAKAPFVFYAQYLSAGKCAFSAVGRPTPERAVQVITSCGGFASLAHPARVEMEKEELFSLLKRLKACGLGGIEAVYSAHTAFDTAYYKETAGALSLEVTGGSDTHYFGGRRKIGSPEFYIGKALADKLSL